MAAPDHHGTPTGSGERPTETRRPAVLRDAIADSRGSVRGPYGVLLHSPDLAARVAHTGTYVRYNLDSPKPCARPSSWPRRGRSKGQYEFFLIAVWRGRLVSPKTPSRPSRAAQRRKGWRKEEAMLVRTCRSYCAITKSAMRRSTPCGTALACKKTLEITALVGHYWLVGQILAAFEVELPDGAKPEIPV